MLAIILKFRLNSSLNANEHTQTGRSMYSTYGASGYITENIYCLSRKYFRLLDISMFAKVFKMPILFLKYKKTAVKFSRKKIQKFEPFKNVFNFDCNPFFHNDHDSNTHPFNMRLK